jgi:hypothetical protein
MIFSCELAAERARAQFRAYISLEACAEWRGPNRHSRSGPIVAAIIQ